MTAALVFLFLSCSVKEQRGDCPCRLTVDLSDASEEYADVLISVFGANGEHCCETIAIPASRKKLFNVSRSHTNVHCLQGLANGRTDGRNVFIPEGCESDRLTAGSEEVDCTGETACCKAAFHKNWTGLSVSYANPDGSEYPFTAEVYGNVNGLALDSMTPLEGAFRCSARHLAEKNMFEVNLPRQKPDGDGLVMRLIRKSDRSVEKEYDLSDIMASAGYDWTAADLDDLKIGIDHAGGLSSITVIDWETGMESSVTI